MADVNRSREWLCLVLILSVLILPWQRLVSEAKAAMAVVDSAVISHTSTTAARLAEQLAEVKNILLTMNGVLDSLGSARSFELTGDLNGILDIGRTANDVLGAVSGQQNAVLDLSAVQDFNDILKTLNRGASVDSVDDAVRLAETLFRQIDKVQGATALRVEQMRASFYQSSTDAAMGTAFFNRQTSSQGLTKVRRIANEATRATDLNQRMAVNTTALLIVAEELMQFRSLMAAQVQMNAAAAYANQPVAAMTAGGVADDDRGQSKNGLKLQ